MRKYNLLYVADYAVVSITIDEAQDEEHATEMGNSILDEYVKNPDEFHLDDITEFDE